MSVNVFISVLGCAGYGSNANNAGSTDTRFLVPSCFVGFYKLVNRVVDLICMDTSVHVCVYTVCSNVYICG